MTLKLQDARLYEGVVSHARREPVDHDFKYKYLQVWLNIDKIEQTCSLSRFWSNDKWNLVSFRRQKYQPSDDSLRQTVQDKIYSKTGERFSGDIYLLANLSYWGMCYNPVVFFFCYNQQGQLSHILTEIHNTPWFERFTYVHPVENPSLNTHKGRANLSVELKKEFHVSPFMPMDLDYDWHYEISNERVLVNMNLVQNSDIVFNACMNLKGKDLNSRAATMLPLRYPFMCLKTVWGIYWNALRLWLKRVPFCTHPDKIEQPNNK